MERTARARILRGVEVAIAAAFPVLALASEGPRAVLRGGVVALWSALAAWPRLFAADPGPTALVTASVLAKLALLFGPAIAALVTAPRHRLAWAPALSVFALFAMPLSHPAVCTVATWTLLAIAGAAASIAVRRKRLRALALLPLFVVFEPALSHTPLADLVWPAARLAGRCEQNDGERPEGYSPDRARPRYYAVTPYRGELLLTGDRGSGWLVPRGDSRYAFGPPSVVHGNFWQGCSFGDALWLTKRSVFVRIERPGPDGAPERVTRIGVPELLGGRIELDLTDPICSRVTRTVFVGQLVRGDILELEPATGELRSHPAGGFNLQLFERGDGLIAGIDSADLFVFDPGERRVVDRVPAGLTAIGLGVCARDGTAAVADMAGRLRVFELDERGRYRFARGVLLPAPRRVDFSPDCRLLAVGSGDDETVRVLDSETLRVERTYRLGPGLRDLTFLDDRRLAVVDACTVSFFDVTR